MASKLDDRLKQLFLELTAIDAVSTQELPVAQYILDFVGKLGLEGRMDDAAKLSGGNAGNVIVPILGGGDFFLAAHMDTPRSTAGLKHCFLPDRITSDGTTPLGVDDRGGVSEILYAVERAAKAGTLQPATLLFSVCEETTMAGSLSYKPAPGIKYGFVFDSFMRPGYFVQATCGMLQFIFHVKGKNAHAGIAPENGVNAIQIAAEAISKFPFGWRGEMANANIGVISGGTGTNVVCDDVFLKGEIRSGSRAEGEACLEGIIHDFRQCCDKYGGSLEVEWAWEFRPYHIHEDDVPYQRFAKAAAACSLQAIPRPTMGGSDANTYNQTGLQAINLGVGAQNPHGNDEFILYEDLQKASDIAYYLLTEKQ